jgi:hypothetical protein
MQIDISWKREIAVRIQLDRKSYDTGTAHRVGAPYVQGNRTKGDPHRSCETLYRKRTGEYFLHVMGGSATDMNGGEAIIPLDPNAARDWARRHVANDVYEAEFVRGGDDTPVALSIQVSKVAYDRIKDAATADGSTMREVVERLTDYLVANDSR